MCDKTSVEQLLEIYGQKHLTAFWDQITEEQRKLLLNDLNSIKFDKVCRAFKETEETDKDGQNKSIDDLLEPLSSQVHQSITRSSKETLNAFRETGLREISEGRVAALLLAGGQGTRLGVNYPKGMYDVGLPSHKTLYQLQGERILRLERLAYDLTGKKASIPWYIMTSEATKEPTIEFFEKHDYFGLPADNVVVFEQSTFPCFQFDGKIILETPYKVARAPDGNGGLYNALKEKGILDDMKRRGIQHIQVYCVDNILVKVADPTFIGYCISKGAEAAAKVVQKAFPTEAVGIICKVQGKYKVVEYSEVSAQTAQKRSADGRLTFDAGNICNHYFTLNFLNNICGKDLIHHIAKKKIPYVNSNGQLVKPDKVNGIKLEKFVFDVFGFTDKFVVWEVLREDEFSPLKNGDGSDKDNPTTARLSIYNLHQRFVLNSGGKFVDENGKTVPLIASPVKVDLNGNTDLDINDKINNNHNESQVICEISPLVSYDGEGLEEYVSGKRLQTPFILSGDCVSEGHPLKTAKLTTNLINGTNRAATLINGHH
ncbi:UDP-N-acetylhexosamine pyrophosphorylase-like [Oppia nitens]|uniref:UDP-N-acetylhexosamine pyrophosphorylase-like n=1 Tax=Oppia nitens TaxID=1686743 RepID=UPI0023DA348F|nr:UDP-N-acetylhexosamine pyrophosphorylase-like [Oppia nitens]